MPEEDKIKQTPSAREPSPRETAMMIADQLGEANEGARAQIMRIVWALGRNQARALLEETKRIEGNGGMMLPNGSRRRTPGGVFFYLVYTTGQPKEGRRLKRPIYKRPDGEQQGAASTSSANQEPVITFTWKDRLTVIREAEAKKGTANVKITLVGRPGKIVDRGACVVTVMESNKVPALPKGLPAPTSVTTKYTVYIASKQWKKVAEAITDETDVLIVEGFPTMDEQAHAIAVFATNTTTRALQIAQKEAQKAKIQEATAG